LPVTLARCPLGPAHGDGPGGRGSLRKSLRSRRPCTLSQMNTYRLAADRIVWSKVGADVVVLELASSTYFTVKGSGTAIVEKLAEGATEDALVQHLVDIFDVDIETARADVARFLGELADKEMLVTVEGERD